MSVAVAPSIFDVFNARQLTPQQVAESFVPPPHFENLVKPTHALIVGPRGSGKTTLLKMLHPAALESWRHKTAEYFRKRIDFTGVFIATDINWNEQVKALGDGRLNVDTHRQFAKAAFTTEILLSLVEAMRYRSHRMDRSHLISHRRVVLTAAHEREIANELISAWHIETAIPTLEGVQLALLRRLSQIKIIASQEAARPADGRENRIADATFLHLDFLAAALVAIDVFDAKTNERGARWALLFDELELAPEWIRGMLFRYLRSVNDRFLFKISLSPYSVDLRQEMEDVHTAGARQDFEPIKLWYVNKEQGYPFCQELLDGILEGFNLDNRNPESLFGISAFATDREDWEETGTAYHSDSQLGRQFEFLYDRDPTFRDYIDRRGINIHQLQDTGGTKRAADIRKARSVVVLRSYFRAQQSEDAPTKKQGRRSRKVPTVYGGAPSIFAMVEGNPRWFIGIIGELLKRSGGKRVPKPVQVRHVLIAADIFRAMLKTIPCGPVGEGRRGLLSLLDPIGEYFSHAALDGPFDPDPPCSFIVDQDVDQESLRALGMALNAGAIVHAPDEGDIGIIDNLRGKRFRLSYILAPHYCVPLVLGRSMTLHELLLRSDRKVKRREPTLFARLDD